MILSVSGRCDIVAFYTPWFMNRYKEGFVDVRNPFYPNLVSRINFLDVDLIVFCTKNPIPIIDHIKEIKIPIIFQVTITPYKEEIEKIKSKKEIIQAVQKLATIFDPEYIYIRYDPIFISPKYTLDYHLKAFSKLTTLLEGSCKHIIVSFLDIYKNVLKNKDILNYQDFKEEDYKIIGRNFSKIAAKHGMTVQTCFEKRNLVEYGFLKADCLSPELAFKLTGKKYPKWRARKGGNCNCCNMVDIGFYNSCLHMCKYCYANYLESEVVTNYKNHDPNSSLLIGSLKETDIIKIRKK